MKSHTASRFNTGPRLAALLLVATLAGMGCRKASMAVAGDGSSEGLQVDPTDPNKVIESFTAQSAAGKIDILFVADNSASMEIEQNSLGTRFATFASRIQGLDWQAGITTTDCSSRGFNICGSLLPLTGGTGRILRPSTPNLSSVFLRTILRPETVDCVKRGSCPSGDEEALRATITAIDKRTGVNAGFFRPGAALAVVILTDEDELSSGPSNATKPQSVIAKVKSALGNSKVFKSYAITTLPGDSTCLEIQKDQQGGIGSYGTHAIELASLTGGFAESICAPNYDTLLSQIGDSLQATVTDSVTLTKIPKTGTVQVKFTPHRNIRWSVNERMIEFGSPIPGGTDIHVSYEIAE